MHSLMWCPLLLTLALYVGKAVGLEKGQKPEFVNSNGLKVQLLNKITLELVESVIDDIKNDFRTTLVEQIQNKDNERNEELKQLTEKINQLTTTVQQLKEKVDAIHGENNILESKTNNVLDLLTNVTNIEKHVLTELEQDIDTLRNTNAYTKINQICNATVPDAVHSRNDIWWEYKTPEEDELDRYMVNQTGCRYQALPKYNNGNLDLPEARLAHARYDWRGAVRGENVALSVEWRERDGYRFRIGDQDNTVTEVFDCINGSLPDLPSPGILSQARYVWFHVTLEPGRLTFRTACDAQVSYSRAVNIQQGEAVRMNFYTWSFEGVKLLVDCPADPE